jgi:hypothetical protein
LNKRGIKIDNQVEVYIEEHGWTLIGTYLYFEDIPVKHKSKKELIQEYVEEIKKHRDAIDKLNMEVNRLEEEIENGE